MGLSYSPPTNIDTILFLELLYTHLHQREVRQPHRLSAGAAEMTGMPYLEHLTVEPNIVVRLLQFVVMLLQFVVMLPVLRNPLKSYVYFISTSHIPLSE